VPWANWIDTVYHGIDLDAFTFNPDPEGYLAFLGRISPEKRVDAAIKIALEAGVPLKIAARMPLSFRDDPNVQADWEYYEQSVEPLLRAAGSQVEFIGEVGGQDKDAFLGNARALLFPIEWPEPFGLVMAEALACGTPVLARGGGSVPEVIEHGATGFVHDSDEQLVDAVRRIDEIDRSRCRLEAERRFSLAAMAARYEAVYDQLCTSFRGRPHNRQLGPLTTLRADAPEAETLARAS
jgi:glycosyltransferase involved in cell wall biosynthesis